MQIIIFLIWYFFSPVQYSTIEFGHKLKYSNVDMMGLAKKVPINVSSRGNGPQPGPGNYDDHYNTIKFTASKSLNNNTLSFGASHA